MKKLLARAFLKAIGWKEGSAPPEAKRCVVLAAPHTSNWDFPIMLAFAVIFDMKINWMGKHTLFKPPFGWLMKALGGVSVDRRAHQNLVEAIVARYEELDALVLCIPPEGTRSLTTHWKSGFYHIARGAQVPIIPGYLDYGQKRGGFGPALLPSGDLHADMDTLRAFYADKSGRRPALFGPVRLKDEEALAEPPRDT